VELYSFGTYSKRFAESFENFRLPRILPQVFPKGFSPQETIDENDLSTTIGIKGTELWGWHWDLSSTYSDTQRCRIQSPCRTASRWRTGCPDRTGWRYGAHQRVRLRRAETD
jgi:hypothetical protein